MSTEKSGLEKKSSADWRDRGNHFIPEVLMRNQSTVTALKHLSQKPAALMFNYFDLKAIGFPGPSATGRVRELLADTDRPTVILSSIGPDRKLDDLRVEDYADTAVRLGADLVFSPDDYIYAIDSAFVTYQNNTHLRILTRTKELLRLARGQFKVAGLVLGRSTITMKGIFDKFAEYGIEDFAFSCGDALKGRSRKDSTAQIETFLNVCKKHNVWHILAGIHSYKRIKRLDPLCFSSSQWSMLASYYKHYDVRQNVQSYRQREFYCKACGNIDKRTHIAIHNLDSDYALAGAVS